MVGRGSIKVAIEAEDEVHGRTRGEDSMVGPLGAEVAGRALTSDSLILGGPSRDTLDPAEIAQSMRDPGAPLKGSQESIFLILPEAQDHGQLTQVCDLLKFQVLTYRKLRHSAPNMHCRQCPRSAMLQTDILRPIFSSAWSWVQVRFQIDISA